MSTPPDNALPQSLFVEPLDYDPEYEAFRQSADYLREPDDEYESTGPGTASIDAYRSPHYLRWSERVLSGLAITKLPKPDWLVENLIPRPSLTFMYGQAKSGKSFAALDIAASVATGRAWSTSPTRQGSVLYVLGEGAAGTGARVDAWSVYHGEVETLDSLHWLREAVNLTDSEKLDSQVDSLIVFARDLGVSLIVLDTLARCTVGADENSTRDMGLVVESLDRLKDSTGAAVLVVHHTGKDATRGMRGSSALVGAADVVVAVTGSEGRVTLKVDQAKDFASGREWHFGTVPVDDSLVIVEGAVPSTSSTEAEVQRLVTVLAESATEEGLTKTAWLELSGMAESTWYKHKKVATDRGLIRNVGSTRTPRWVTAD